MEGTGRAGERSPDKSRIRAQIQQAHFKKAMAKGGSNGSGLNVRQGPNLDPSADGTSSARGAPGFIESASTDNLNGYSAASGRSPDPTADRDPSRPPASAAAAAGAFGAPVQVTGGGGPSLISAAQKNTGGWGTMKNKNLLASLAASSTKLSQIADNIQKDLRSKARGIGLLATETRAWLHVNKYGMALARPVDGSTPPPNDAADGEVKASWRSIISHYRQALWLLMTESDSSKAAYAVSMLVMGAILISTISFCLETVPAYSEDRNAAADETFTIIETVTVQIFAADYLLRLISCPNLWQFIIAPLNIIDLISIVPWYIEKALSGSALQGTAVFRVLRLLRVFRVLKLGARYRKLLIVTTAFAKSLDMLLLMSFFVGLIVVVAATLLFFAERGEFDETLGYYVRTHEKYTQADGDPIVSPFESIPSGFWWAIVTLMTVGYGDVVPLSVGGRFVACATMLCGLLAIALPVAVIGTNFASEWESYKRRRGGSGQSTSPHLDELTEALDAHVSTVTDIEDMLESAVAKLADMQSEVRERGELRISEMEALLRQRGASMTTKQVEAVREVVACLCRLGMEPQSQLFQQYSMRPPHGSATGSGSGGVEQQQQHAEDGDVLTEMPKQPELQSKTSGDQNPSASSRVSFAVEATAAGRMGTGDGADLSAGSVGIGRHSGGVYGAASLRVLRSMNVAAVTAAATHAADGSVRPNGPAAGPDFAAVDTSVRSGVGAAGMLPPGAYNGLGGVGVHGWRDNGAAVGADPPAPEPRAALANKIKECLDLLVDTPMYERMIEELNEALELESEVYGLWSQLVKVLRAVALLTGGLLPEELDLMRSQYRQLVTLGKEAAELHARLDVVAEDLADVDDALERPGLDVVMGVVKGLAKQSSSGVREAASRKGSRNGRAQRSAGAKGRPAGAAAVDAAGAAVLSRSSSRSGSRPPSRAASVTAAQHAAAALGIDSPAGAGDVRGEGSAVGHSGSGGWAGGSRDATASGMIAAATPSHPASSSFRVSSASGRNKVAPEPTATDTGGVGSHAAPAAPSSFRIGSARVAPMPQPAASAPAPVGIVRLPSARHDTAVAPVSDDAPHRKSADLPPPTAHHRPGSGASVGSGGGGGRQTGSETGVVAAGAQSGPALERVVEDAVLPTSPSGTEQHQQAQRHE
ncbi:hypothetical protein HXX76_003617 [Chlamydomonas incerta]|uniref:Ion transport domain-containing protein n=1 Tax=Chlamydomonas incerta TaxID=51695 RepID=A0A835TKZ1_CHLIN|nr:hypothetical protein HXX76_003617 [Chlamydomonas incerta]|eukprot:KAG2440760.1 hypothetical protein HXX76_003617 [Chlamydomonas incerta]